MKRAMCVYFPHWPLQRLLHDQPPLRDRPLAVVQPHAARGAKVRVCSQGALDLGVRPGMPVAEVDALAPQVYLEEEEPRRDRDALTNLAVWAERYSPLVGLEDGPEPECLVLDVTGCASCFHGEDNLLRRVRSEFWDAGWWVRPAIADTLGGAWALAHFVEKPMTAPAGETRKHLESLPVAALRLGEGTRELLGQLGIRTIGQVLELPRRDLTLRFDVELVRRLDQALGQTAEVIQPHPLKPEIEAFFSFEYPVDHLPTLKVVLERLAAQVEEMLRGRHVGARQVECRLLFAQSEPCCFEIGLFRPTQSATHLCKMLLGRLEQIRLEGPVWGMSLRVPSAEPIPENQGDFLEPAADGEALASLLDQLSNSLGQDEVMHAELVADYQPEYACRYQPVTQKGRKDRKAKGKKAIKGIVATPGPLRPVKLWPSPVPVQVLGTLPGGSPARFRWGNQDFEVVCSWGPERIETGWWRGPEVQRDYFVLVTQRGSRFWMFRHPGAGWYLHGSFD